MHEIDSTTTPAAPAHPAIERLRAELAEIELDVTTAYTLADAMREGARVTGQLRNGYVNTTQSCGLGAAFLSATARGYLA